MSLYYFGQPVRFIDNNLVRADLLSGTVTPAGNYIGYRTDYSDVEEIVDRKYWQPSTVAVSQVGKHPVQGQSMYDSPELLKSVNIASLNASIRHPSNDIVDTTVNLNKLKKITIEVAESDIRSQLKKAEEERQRNAGQSSTVANTPSIPPESTIGG